MAREQGPEDQACYTLQRRADVQADSLTPRAEDRANASLRLRMTICPDNLTECLLRALLDAGNSFDLNPLNFAFSAAAGTLALLIACIAMFQGLLAAGPGMSQSLPLCHRPMECEVDVKI